LGFLISFLVNSANPHAASEQAEGKDTPADSQWETSGVIETHDHRDHRHGDHQRAEAEAWRAHGVKFP